jgi:molybdate transport system permease protein
MIAGMWTDVWPPLRFSLEVAAAASGLAALVGIPLAYLAARLVFRGKSLIEAALTVPLVLPPTVVGFFLLVLLGRNGWIGRPLARVTGGYTVIFQPAGGVIAAAVVAFPLLFIPARAAFAGVDRELEDMARLMGAGPVATFWHVSLPLARRGIAAGLLLCFARALGEFGATTMVLGEFPNRSTLPISIYNDWVSGNLEHAVAAVAALTAISLGVILVYNRWPGAGRRN